MTVTWKPEVAQSRPDLGCMLRPSSSGVATILKLDAGEQLAKSPLGAHLDFGSVVLCLEPQPNFAGVDARGLGDIANGPDFVHRTRFRQKTASDLKSRQRAWCSELGERIYWSRLGAHGATPTTQPLKPTSL